MLTSVLCSSENVDQNYLGGAGKLVRAFEEILENPARKLGGTAGHMEHGRAYDRMKTPRKEKTTHKQANRHISLTPIT